jgi:ABC-type branched-subunit amino acid transport system substrate-binding protein
VALVSAFSGPGGVTGTYLANGLQVEIDQLNARGGLLGNRVELVLADDEQNSAKAGELVREHLAEVNVKLLVGPGSTATFMAARAAIAQSGVPNCLAAPVTDDAMNAAQGSFRVTPPDRDRVAALLGYVQKRTQVRRIALLSGGDALDQSVDRQISQQASKLGLEYVGSVGPGDATALVQQLAQRGVQGVVLPEDPALAGQATRAIQDLGLHDQLHPLGFDGLGRYAYIQFAGDAIAGAVFAGTVHSYLTDQPESRWPDAYRNFVQRIVGSYGYATGGVEIKGLPEGAECFLLWARAVQQADSFDRRDVVRAWEALRVPAAEAALGVGETFSPRDHEATTPDTVFVYQWARNGGRSSLKQVAGPGAGG